MIIVTIIDKEEDMVKKSFQREAIRQNLLSRYDHPTADMVYNVFKYQLVKYLGVFNLIYQHIMAQKEGVSIDEISGITTLLQKLEYNAFSSKALILSDYGVPFKLVDYYDDPNGRKNFDSYEQYIDSKVSRIVK